MSSILTISIYLCSHFTGCDKTVPAQLMGGISANKPILPLITGPMLPGSHRGQRIGACTDCRNNWAAFRAGEIDVEEISAINEELAPTVCSCLPNGIHHPAKSIKRSGLVASWELRAQWPALRLHWE
jgi:hypothetical protein